MAQKEISGRTELRAALWQSRGLIYAAAIFSLVVNVLMLTGPLYMLNVYDRVLGSKSVATLVALSVIVAFLFVCMAILDFVRGRLMARVGARLQSTLDERVFRASLDNTLSGNPTPEGMTGLRDLEAVQRALTSPVAMSAFDLPWMPLFFVGIFIFHPWLGYLALGGAAVLIALALLNQSRTRAQSEKANQSAGSAERYGQNMREEADQIRAMGMESAVLTRWQTIRNQALGATMAFSDTSGFFTATTRGTRLFLQSAMLGLGAYIVLQGELTAGAMIAGSILLGRALAPIETLIGQWSMVERAREGWRNLSVLLGNARQNKTRTDLPVPNAKLTVDQLTVFAPGATTPALRLISFDVKPGQAVGVIGPSGAGKSSLAYALIGLWPAMSGTVRLDGATLDQYEPDTLGKYVGYLPQRIQLFEGTIAENIARMALTPDSEKVVSAAKLAAAHDMILKLPNGYDTQVDINGGRLSGGQIQRIGLARALYGDPVLVVLDEPNSNLDNDGNLALNLAIQSLKEQGKAVLIMAHRPAAVQECDTLLVIENGLRRAFGPKDDVLRQLVQNHQTIQSSTGGGGVS